MSLSFSSSFLVTTQISGPCWTLDRDYLVNIHHAFIKWLPQGIRHLDQNIPLIKLWMSNNIKYLWVNKIPYSNSVQDVLKHIIKFPKQGLIPLSTNWIFLVLSRQPRMPKFTCWTSFCFVPPATWLPEGGNTTLVLLVNEFS